MLEIKIRRIPRGWATHKLALYEDGYLIDAMNYMDYTRREMLRDFKARTGIRGKHGVKIIDLTRR